MKRILDKNPEKNYQIVANMPFLGLSGIEIDSCYKLEADPGEYFFEVHPASDRDQHCPICGSTSYTKEGTARPRIVYDLPIDKKQTRIKAKMVRYKCKVCGCRFSHRYEELVPNKMLSVRLYKYLQHRVFFTSMRELETQYNVDISTMMDILEETGNALDSERLIKAPLCLGIDRISIKTQECYVFTDAKSGKIIDISKNISPECLISVLERIGDRKTVKIVIMDMAVDCDSVLNTYFPNARLVIDKAHMIKKLTPMFAEVYSEILNNLEEINKNVSNERERQRRDRIIKRARTHAYVFEFQSFINPKPSVDTEEIEYIERKIPEIKIFQHWMVNLLQIYTDMDNSLTNDALEDWITSVKQESIIHKIKGAENLSEIVMQCKEKVCNYLQDKHRIDNYSYTDIEKKINLITQNGGSRKFNSIRFKLLFSDHDYWS